MFITKMKHTCRLGSCMNSIQILCYVPVVGGCSSLGLEAAFCCTLAQCWALWDSTMQPRFHVLP